MDPISSPVGVQPDLEKSKFHRVKGENFMIYCNCPITDLKISRYKTAVFSVLGNGQQMCDMHIVSRSKLRHSNFEVSLVSDKKEVVLKDLKSTDLLMEYRVGGDDTVKIKWN